MIRSKAKTKAKSDRGDRWFRSAPAYGVENEGVDLDAGIIYGLAVCTAGEAKGHGVQLDETFIAEVTKHGKKTKRHGLKARFGHPAASGTALGSFLGRIKNFRTDVGGGSDGGDITRADLHVDPVADKSPDGELGTYVLELAEADPTAFGMSIVFTPGDSYQVDDDGDKVFDRSLFTNDRPTFATLKKLHASDLVDDPAANPSGLFCAGSFGSELTFAGQVSAFLDDHPQIYQAIDADPEILDGFLERYEAYKARENGAPTKGPDEMKKDTPKTETPETPPTETPETPPTETPETPETPPTETPETPETPGDEFSAARTRLGEYVEAFGAERGAEFFRDGVSFADGMKKHTKALEATIAEQALKLAAGEVDRGEKTPLGFNGGDDPSADAAAIELSKLTEAYGGNEARAKRTIADRRKAGK